MARAIQLAKADGERTVTQRAAMGTILAILIAAYVTAMVVLMT
jgi:hypothetical protein